LWDRPGLYYLNQHIFKISVHGCDKRWLYWALKAATHWIERELTSGMIGMVHVTREELGGVPIPIPPLNLQRDIAEFLDVETARIDQLSKLRNAVKAKLDERTRALRDNLVDELAESASAIPLRRFVTQIEQGVSPQCEAIPRETADEWGVLKLSAVKGGNFESKENKLLPDGVEPFKAYEVRVGDLLVTRANTPKLVGDVAVASGEVRHLLLPDLIYRVGLTPGISAEYVAQIALSSRVRLLIESAARGSSQSMVKLRGEDIKEWPIPVVNLSRQDQLVREIIRGVEAVTRLRSAVDRQLNLLAERRQALITAAVTGQIDVSTASGRGLED
jgi:type I restriction enzyme S subunit